MLWARLWVSWCEQLPTEIRKAAIKQQGTLSHSPGRAVVQQVTEEGRHTGGEVLWQGGWEAHWQGGRHTGREVL